MKELMNQLSDTIVYESYEADEISYRITIKSAKDTVRCPYCGEQTHKRHSVYIKKVQDLPIQGKKVVLNIKRRTMFCSNPACVHKTFAERFDFVNNAETRTNRLDKAITELSVNMSSVAASKLICKSMANIGKSTLCSMFKKINQNDC